MRELSAQILVDTGFWSFGVRAPYAKEHRQTAMVLFTVARWLIPGVGVARRGE
jgi:hypothetical protein